MFQREESAGRLQGYSLKQKNVFFFFGARGIGREDLFTLYPEYEHTFLKQVHGALIVPASPDSPLREADAHFTSRVTRAPVVQTADCIPLLLASKNRVAAVHAGWRGVEKGIVSAAKRQFDGERVLYAAIGPHIMAESFEVGMDVGARLAATAPPTVDPRRYQLPHPQAAKVYFDLTQLVRDQLTAAFGAELKILECLHDTLTSFDFHSFRRDGALAGRQYSFVVLNE